MRKTNHGIFTENLMKKNLLKDTTIIKNLHCENTNQESDYQSLKDTSHFNTEILLMLIENKNNLTNPWDFFLNSTDITWDKIAEKNS